MNMMVNTSELANEAEMKNQNKLALNNALTKLVASWEKKQANKITKLSGLGLMAVSLAACNSSSDDTTTSTTTTTTTTETTTPAAPTTNAITLTQTDTSVFGTTGNDVITGTNVTYTANHIIADTSTTDADSLTINTQTDITNTPTVIGIETINFNIQAAITTDTEFDVDVAGVGASTINLDVDFAGSSIVSAEVTNVATGSTVNTNADFTGTTTVTGDDNAAVTVNAVGAIIANSGGALTGATLTSTSAAAVKLDTDSDAAATLTATGAAADLSVDAIAATTVTGTSAAALFADNGNGTSEDLTLATTVNLTASDEIIAKMDAATAATMSAGFGDAATVTESTITSATLTSVNVSGNGSAPRFDLNASPLVATVNISGDQNVIVEMGADDITALTGDAVTVTDTSTGTSTLAIGANAGGATNVIDLTAAGVDIIQLEANQNGIITVASGANVVVGADQTGGNDTFDGPDAGAATNVINVAINDGNATNAATAALNAAIFTDLKTVNIDASGDDAGATLTALVASADNSDMNITGHATAATAIATSIALGTGALTLTGNGGAFSIANPTAASVTATGSGAVTGTGLVATSINTITTSSGADDLTFTNTGASLSISTGDGNDVVEFTAASTANMTYSIDMGAGSGDELQVRDGTTFTNGTTVLTGVERINLITDGGADGMTMTLNNSILSGKNFVFTTATAEVATITIDMTANEVIADLDGLVFDNGYQAANDIIVVSEAGNLGNMTVTGTTLINQITTGAGNDTITTGDAADVIVTGNGTNNVTTFASASDGGDTVTGGTGVDTISTGAGADTITGGTGDDNLTAGEGADKVIVGAGADQVVLTETTSAADNVAIVAKTDGSAVGVAGGTFTGFNVITGFTTGTDDIVFDGNANADDTVNTDIIRNGTAGLVKAGTAANNALNDITMSNYTSVDQVVNFLGDAGVAFTEAGNQDQVVAVTIGTDFTAVYAFIEVGNNTAAATAAELHLIATVDETLVAADIIC